MLSKQIGTEWMQIKISKVRAASVSPNYVQKKLPLQEEVQDQKMTNFVVVSRFLNKC